MPCRIRTLTVLVAGALSTLAVGPSAVAARVLPGDAFLCASAKPARAGRNAPPLPTFHPRVGVAVIDRFTRPLPSELYTLDLQKPEAFCRPVRLDAADLADALSGFETYVARRTPRRPAPPPLPSVGEVIETIFGSTALRVGGIEALKVPTLATGSVGGSGPERDHFACYEVRPERGATARGALRVEVRTADGARTVEVRKPVRLCVPASVRGDDAGAPKHPLDLLCYDARLPRGSASGASAAETLATRNAFGNEVLKVGSPRLLCVPAARTDVVVPTPTPFPTLTPPPTPTATGTPVPTPRVPTMRVVPSTIQALVHDRVCYSAFFDLPDGSTVDVSATARWQVDGAVAAPAGLVDGQKCFVGIAIGTTDVVARDAGTGIASPPARLRSEWPVYALAVTPKQLGIRVGDAQPLTVQASFTTGRVRNVTQYVTYASDDEGVARAPNLDGNRSRIEGAGEGNTTIVVSDPFSSLTDTAEVSVGVLSAIQVGDSPYLFPGEHTSLHATGVLSGGFATNLTQDVSYDSSDPTIVVATNAPGDRSRIEGVHPGTAAVNAFDPVTGLRSTCCATISVLGDVLALSLSPSTLRYRVGFGGDALAIRAFGTFAVPPASMAFRAASERLTWSVQPPGVVAFGAIDRDDFQQLTALAGGSADLVATDPATGIAATASVVVYDRLDRIDVGTDRSDPTLLDEPTIPVNGSVRYYAHASFDGGTYRLLDDLRSEVRFTASPPDVVAFYGSQAVGIGPGTATIDAIDVPSGRSATSTGGRTAVLHVYGGTERVAVSPSRLTLELGQADTLTALAYKIGGGVKTITQQASYVSSDPSVVLATNEAGNRSRIVAVGVGTATISATESGSGVGSAASGDDAVVTVVSHAMVRIVVTPPLRRLPAATSTRFTATGYLATGETRNITQRVEWRSSDPAVAVAPNVDGDRSRIDALTPGTTVVSVYDPVSGLSSSDGIGGDATFTVAALTSLVLTPATLELVVGDAFALTTVGTVDGAAPINVTQDAVYVSSDPTIVRAANAIGSKSFVEAVAPGVATITATRDSTYAQATMSNSITVTVVDAAPAP